MIKVLFQQWKNKLKEDTKKTLQIQKKGKNIPGAAERG